MILRQPADRAYSNYLMMVRDGRESLSDFFTAFLAEEDRIAKNWGFGWHYKRLGLYSQQVKKYQQMFDPNQLRIYLYDDLVKDLGGLTRNLCDFLEIDHLSVEADGLRENRSGIPKYDWLTYLIRRGNPLKRFIQSIATRGLRKKLAHSLLDSNLQASPRLDPAIRQKVTDLYRADILVLQDLIQRDLSGWLK